MNFRRPYFGDQTVLLPITKKKFGHISKTIFIFVDELSFMERLLFLIIIILTSAMLPSKAQQKINFAEANLGYCKPTGYFGKNIREPQLVFEVGYLRQLKVDKPLFWGVSVYYTQLGFAGATLDELLDFNLVTFDYCSTSNLLGFNGKMRFYPNFTLGKIEIYTEAQLGYKYLFTNTTKTLANSNSGSSSTHLEEGTLSLTYGVSGGLNIPLNNQLYLNVRANYLPGLSVGYYNLMKDNMIRVSSLDKFVLKHSTTDIVRIDLGVTYKFTNLVNSEN